MTKAERRRIIIEAREAMARGELEVARAKFDLVGIQVLARPQSSWN